MAGVAPTYYVRKIKGRYQIMLAGKPVGTVTFDGDKLWIGEIKGVGKDGKSPVWAAQRTVHLHFPMARFNVNIQEK